jgi:hypothetical protein
MVLPIFDYFILDPILDAIMLWFDVPGLALTELL